MENLISKSYEILKRLKLKNNLYLAAPSEKTGYKKIWIRDNLYISFGVEVVDRVEAEKIIHGILKIMIKHAKKIDSIKTKPSLVNDYIHARYNPETLEEYDEKWGNKQNDVIGILLFRVGNFLEKGMKLDENEKKIIEKLIKYLEIIEYWHEKDNGMWENDFEEVHSSSIGACIAGLKIISKYFNVSPELINKGSEELKKILPRESKERDIDLSLLSLIYPYNLLENSIKKEVLKNIEEKLVKKRGIIRYSGDHYYNKNGEAEWTMGFPWLAIIYKNMDNKKYNYYIKKSIKVRNEKGEFPELYFSDSGEYNDNTPLGWAHSLFIVALDKQEN